MIIKTIVKTYTQYVLAYDKYIDKYMVNKCEEDAIAESEVCDKLYDDLSIFVRAICIDEDMHYDLMDILSRTVWATKKIDMANNLQNFFNYID